MDILIRNGKLAFQNGAFQLTSDHLESVSQRLYIRLKSTKFKWFWNTEYGVNWFGKVFGKTKNKTRIDLLLKQEIMKEKWIESITSFSSNIDRYTRVYSCTFKAKVVGITQEQEYFVITTQNGFIITTDNKKSIVTPR